MISMAVDETTRAKRKERLSVDREILLRAWKWMCMTTCMSELYETNRDLCSRYVHSTSRGHEAIQLAAGLQLQPHDYASLYYRDEALLLSLGLTPYELMLQLMAKRDDPFSGGRTYYGHPSLKREGFPTIPHQSSATGMQAIPATGMAHGLAYLQSQGLLSSDLKSIVLCSLGDAAVTEGEVAEAFQMAVLKKLPILFLIQDNGLGISATAKETRSMNAYEYALGFKGLERITVDGTDFVESYTSMKQATEYVREGNGPMLVHANCVLLGHHTSGVRKEWYRNMDDFQRDADPLIKLQKYVAAYSDSDVIERIKREAFLEVHADFDRAKHAPDPIPNDFDTHEFAPTEILHEIGERSPKDAPKVTMVDAALHAIGEILSKHPEALFYGQDVGASLGGVFREAALLAQKFGDARVFNTPIQEAYIVGSTAGMSAVGAKPIVEIQFADYIWPSLNQLVEELSKSCYLSKGKFPIQSLIRIPIGAYGGGGPYHSGSIESTLLNIRGIKVVYPSNAADMKGLLKAAFYDPNPVVVLEHKGLYWSKIPSTAEAKCIEPDETYCTPLGKSRCVLEANKEVISNGVSCCVITYGMGVYWSKEACNAHSGQVEIIDLRTLNPLDWHAIVEAVKRHGRVVIVTEEPLLNSFAESLAGRISSQCFEYLDAPIQLVGAGNLPAVPLNIALEKMMLPNAEKVASALLKVLRY
jgi:2-oxoisovalerate dehydrogenase E1 component